MPTSQLHATVGMRGEYEEKISLHFCRERERETRREREEIITMYKEKDGN